MALIPVSPYILLLIDKYIYSNFGRCTDVVYPLFLSRENLVSLTLFRRVAIAQQGVFFENRKKNKDHHFHMYFLTNIKSGI